MRQVAEELASEDVLTPRRVTSLGRAYGGCRWSRGQLYKLLANPIYLGLIEHNGVHHPGRHPAIIDLDLWERVQARLAENLQGHRSGARAASPSLLAGKVEDASGTRLIAEHACKRSGTTPVRYRYYVTRRGDGDELRVPARELEALATERIAHMLADPLALATSLSLALQPHELRRLQGAGTLAGLARDRAFVGALVACVKVLGDRVEIECATAPIATLLAVDPPETTTHMLTVPARLTRSGRVVKPVDPGGAPLIPAPDTALLRLIAKAIAGGRSCARARSTSPRSRPAKGSCPPT